MQGGGRERIILDPRMNVHLDQYAIDESVRNCETKYTLMITSLSEENTAKIGELEDARLQEMTELRNSFEFELSTAMHREINKTVESTSNDPITRQNQILYYRTPQGIKEMRDIVLGQSQFIDNSCTPYQAKINVVKEKYKKLIDEYRKEHNEKIKKINLEREYYCSRIGLIKTIRLEHKSYNEYVDYLMTLISDIDGIKNMDDARSYIRLLYKFYDIFKINFDDAFYKNVINGVQISKFDSSAIKKTILEKDLILYNVQEFIKDNYKHLKNIEDTIVGHNVLLVDCMNVLRSENNIIALTLAVIHDSIIDQTEKNKIILILAEAFDDLCTVTNPTKIHRGSTSREMIEYTVIHSLVNNPNVLRIMTNMFNAIQHTGGYVTRIDKYVFVLQSDVNEIIIDGNIFVCKIRCLRHDDPALETQQCSVDKHIKNDSDDRLLMFIASFNTLNTFIWSYDRYSWTTTNETAVNLTMRETSILTKFFPTNRRFFTLQIPVMTSKTGDKYSIDDIGCQNVVTTNRIDMDVRFINPRINDINVLKYLMICKIVYIMNNMNNVPCYILWKMIAKYTVPKIVSIYDTAINEIYRQKSRGRQGSIHDLESRDQWSPTQYPPSKDRRSPIQYPPQDPSRDRRSPTQYPPQDPSRDRRSPTQYPPQDPSRDRRSPTYKPTQEKQKPPLP